VLPEASLERIAAIREGFSALLPVSEALAHGRIQEIQQRVLGVVDIDVDDLRANFDPSYTEQEKWLWDWLEGSSSTTRRKFIHFLTGLSELPFGGVSALPVKPSIIVVHGWHNGPMADTCSLRLSIPNYRSSEELAEWMSVVVESSFDSPFEF
jgi:hypothetical protein